MIDSPWVKGTQTVDAASCGYYAGKKANGRKRFLIGTAETLCKWVRQVQVDGGVRSRTASVGSEELKRLWRANEILKLAPAFFAAEFLCGRA